MTVKRHAVDVLKHSLMQDLQRPNLFEVLIDTNGKNSDNDSTIMNLTSNLIVSVSFPSTIIGAVTINRMGRKLIIPGDVQNPADLTISVYADVEGRTRSFFDAWQRAYYGSDSKNGTNTGGSISKTVDYANPLTYAEMGTVTVYALDGNHDRRNRVTMYKVFPRIVGEMQFSHNTENSLTMFSITLAFSYAEYTNFEPSHSSNYSAVQFGISSGQL